MSNDVVVSRIIDVARQPDGVPSTNAHRERAPSSERAIQRVERAPSATVRHGWARRGGAVVEHEHVLQAPLDPRLVLLRESSTDRARSYRLLRHRLLCHGDPRIVAVTSARAGEGKTTCALNLALAMAEDAMARVLLVDANLRRPGIARAFGFTPSPRFYEAMTQFAVLGPPYPVVGIGGTRLHVAPLPAGSLDGERLDRTFLGVALADLREAYDYVVLDAASVLESGDVDVVAEASAGVLLAVRAGISRARDVRRAVAQLAPAPVLGSVLIDT